jgi:hypothetical protein
MKLAGLIQSLSQIGNRYLLFIRIQRRRAATATAAAAAGRLVSIQAVSCLRVFFHPLGLHFRLDFLKKLIVTKRSSRLDGFDAFHHALLEFFFPFLGIHQFDFVCG